ncbi:MAG: ROK family protein [Clostridiales bacterium]|nr:ROK family protein [Clostridiales bacterium]
MKIALDLGGTNIRAARIDNGSCYDKLSVPCRATESEDVIIDQLSSLIGQLLCGEVDGIGIGVPSVVDPVNGIVYNAVNIASWKEVHLREKLENRFNIPVKVNNDCNCFALGESRYGAAKGLRNVVGITLGTGVGAGLILDGNLYSGALCGAGEIGSLPYRDSDYEHYCSSLWFRDAHGTTGALLAERVGKGDTEASLIWNEFGDNLGQLCEVILYAYAPEAIVIGGGIAAAFPLFIDSLKSTLTKFPYQAIASNCQILKATLPDANLLGASLL